MSGLSASGTNCQRPTSWGFVSGQAGAADKTSARGMSISLRTTRVLALRMFEREFTAGPRIAEPNWGVQRVSDPPRPMLRQAGRRRPGNWLEILVSRPSPWGAFRSWTPLVPSPSGRAFAMDHTVVHFEIPADQPERAAKFYRELFGWEISRWEGPAGTGEGG